MIFRVRLLNETRFSRGKSLDDHYKKHVADTWSEYFFEEDDEIFEPMSADEYDDCAHDLSVAKVKTSDVNSSDQYVGFVMRSGKILKFGKKFDEIVIYDARTKESARTVTYYKVRHKTAKWRYQELKNKHYIREITDEDEKYNS